MIDPGTLLPSDRSLFRYMGSLTTPPCTQGIVWTLLRQPIEASPDQIRQFAALFTTTPARCRAQPPLPVADILTSTRRTRP